MSKLKNQLPDNYFDRVEVAGEKFKKEKEVKPFNLIMEADNFIFKSITK